MMGAFARFGDSRLPDRFWDKVAPCPMSGCWLWTASLTQSGYGQWQMDGLGSRAHRIAFHLLVGTPPDGLDLDHLCRVRCCVNPAHLEAVSRRVNLARGDTSKRAHISVAIAAVAALRRAATRCSRGHEFDAANTKIDGRGNRSCRKCVAAAARRRRAEATGP